MDSATAQSASVSFPSSVMAFVVARAHIASVLFIWPYAVRDETIATNIAIMKILVFMTRASCDV
jgi:hypothetical protein